MLVPGVTEKQVERVKGMTERAKKACMISNALRGDVAWTVEATVEVMDENQK